MEGIIQYINNTKSEPPIHSGFSDYNSQTNDMFKCDLCGKMYEQKWYLMSHYKFDHECEPCGKVFSTETELTDHIKLTHNDDFGHKCAFCKEACNTGNDFINHMELKHEDYIDQFSLRILMHVFINHIDLNDEEYINYVMNEGTTEE